MGKKGIKEVRMDLKGVCIPATAPLSAADSETQTYGCRRNDPTTCVNSGLPGVCAFTSDDCICRKPSQMWKKQYARLKEKEHMSGTD